jgi:hypothetical protein
LVLRVEKLEALKGNSPIYRDMADVLVFDAADRIRKAACDAIYSFAAPEEATKPVKAIEKLSATAGVNVKEARRRIAGKLIEDNQYKF